MSDLYPEPPHLSAFVGGGLELSRSLRGCWEVLRGAKCEFTGNVLVAREPARFLSVSDVEREVIRYSGAADDLLMTYRPLRIEFRHRSLGSVALGLAPVAAVGEAHPLEVAIHAGPLALPVELWSRQQRHAAKRVLSWLEQVLLAMSESTEALYGAIGIEAVFPTTGALATAKQRTPWRPTTWFWSDLVSEKEASREAELLETLSDGTVTRVTAGTLFRAWVPGARVPVDEDAIDRVVSFLERAVAAPR